MNRRKFIYSSCTLAFTAGTIGLAACSKDDDGGGGPGGNNPKLSANLSSELTSVGSYKIQNNVIVVRTAEGNVPSSFVALTTVCTHEACSVGYQSETNRFVCPCHGSTYDINGSVLLGPAPAPLRRYSVTVENNMLTVA